MVSASDTSSTHTSHSKLVPPILPPLVAIRGAITVEVDTPEAIFQAVKTLLEQLQHHNGIVSPEHQLLQAFFSVTDDLHSVSVAKAAREQMTGWHNVAMMCFQEVDVEKLPPRCVRVLLNAYGATLPASWQMVPVYLEGARVLRPDWQA